MPTTPSNGGKQTIVRWTNRIDGPPVALQPGEIAVSVRSRRIFVGTEGTPIVLTEAAVGTSGSSADPGDLVALLEDGLLPDPQVAGYQPPVDLDLVTLFEIGLL
jgi:hypothetical protein